MVTKAILLLKFLLYFYIVVLYNLDYYFSYREQMAKEMSEILSRLVQCNLGR